MKKVDLSELLSLLINSQWNNTKENPPKENDIGLIKFKNKYAMAQYSSETFSNKDYQSDSEKYENGYYIKEPTYTKTICNGWKVIYWDVKDNKYYLQSDSFIHRFDVKEWISIENINICKKSSEIKEIL